MQSSRSGICEVFQRTTKLNVAIWTAVLITIIMFSTLYIRAEYAENTEEVTKYRRYAKIIGLAGTIIIAALFAWHQIYNEFYFTEKCNSVDNYVKNVVGDIKKSLTLKTLRESLTKRAKKSLQSVFGSEKNVK